MSMILVLIVGWFYAVFLACLVHVRGMFWEDNVAGGQGLFRVDKRGIPRYSVAPAQCQPSNFG